jgi:hypothetical protein
VAEADGAETVEAACAALRPGVRQMPVVRCGAYTITVWPRVPYTDASLTPITACACVWGAVAEAAEADADAEAEAELTPK